MKYGFRYQEKLRAPVAPFATYCCLGVTACAANLVKMARLPLMTTSSTDAADRQNVDHSDHQDLQRRGVFIVFAALGPGKWVPRSGLGWQMDHFFGYLGLTLMVCLVNSRTMAM
jgi:hypothetical protein